MRIRRCSSWCGIPVFKGQLPELNKLASLAEKQGGSMGRIHLPPNTVGGGISRAATGVAVESFPMECDPNTDPIYFIVDKNGYFVRFGDGLFSPDIPDGPVAAGSIIGPLFPQVTTGNVVVGFYESAIKTVFIFPIQIAPSCT